VTSAALRPFDGLRAAPSTVEGRLAPHGEGLAQGRPRDRMPGVPNDGLPQIAMTGRSNVGKSTLLNALCRSKVARTSAAPGKTRLANVYRLVVEGGGPGKWSLYLVDLPGYGYARGGEDAAAELKGIAEGYFAADWGLKTPALQQSDVGREQPDVRREQSDVGRGLQTRPTANREPRTANREPAALLLVDSRHPGLDSDIQASHWLDAMHVDYRIVATKIDKLTRSERARNVKALELTFGMPPLPVSAASGEGMDTLWKTIASLARTGHA
jgi:GTP-binding protein